MRIVKHLPANGEYAVIVDDVDSFAANLPRRGRLHETGILNLCLNARNLIRVITTSGIITQRLNRVAVRASRCCLLGCVVHGCTIADSQRLIRRVNLSESVDVAVGS